MVTKLVMLGCGGFIGSHLLDLLLPSGEYEIEGWDLDDQKIEQHVDRPNFHFHRRGIQEASEQALLRDAIGRSDAVINLAAICNPAEYNTRPLDVIRANFLDIYSVVGMCADHRRWLIAFSTCEVYGRTLASYLPPNLRDDPQYFELDEESTPFIMGPIRNQRWTYATAKALMERFVYAHHKERGLPFTIVRPLNFFGPRMDYIPGRDGEGTPRVLACFMSALLNREPMQLVDGGMARRTIVSIYEAVDAIGRMLRRPQQAQNQIFNIGNRNNETTIAELADRMRRTYARITGDASYEDHPIVSVSSEAFYGEGYEDCDRRMPSTVKASSLLDWTPTIPLDDVLHDTMTYFHRAYATAQESVHVVADSEFAELSVNTT
jgi:UDP-apiose/xylose synthase